MDAPHKMLEGIRAGYRRAESWTGLARLAPNVEAAMLEVERSRFVPPELSGGAWEDRALSIGHGATISQPFIVALMTELARLRPESRVLEVGTGSGYQAAVLAELAAEVFTLEIVPELRVRSAKLLRRLGYDNVQVLCRDGWSGLPEEAPFDAIVVTACARKVPAELCGQLAPSRRLVIPIGTDKPQQELYVVEKDDAGKISRRLSLPVSFVPMTGRGH